MTYQFAFKDKHTNTFLNLVLIQAKTLHDAVIEFDKRFPNCTVYSIIRTASA